jgi:NitT/TauT family transport system substrate-binding protein
MTRRYSRAAAGICAAVLAVATAACGSQDSGSSAASGGQRELTIKAAAATLTIAVPLTMVANDTDRAHGLAVDLQASGTSSTHVVDAVIAGDAEYGSAGTPTVLHAIREGADLKIIAAVVNNLHLMVIRDDVMQRLGVPPTAPIEQRVHALKGLTIATGAIGSAHYQMLRAYLKKYGLDPDKDIKLVGVEDTAALLSGIDHKRYDAIAYGSGIVEQAVANTGAKVWISNPRGDIPGGADVKTSLIFARAETVEKNKADVDALRAALTDALQSVRNDRDATGRTLRAKNFPELDPAVWDLAWKTAAVGYPSSLAFPRVAYDYWVANDPNGPDGYKGVDYTKVTYAPAQSS